MIRGFRDFLLRGNVVDLAVAVVIGAAFGAVVTALVEGVVNPLVAALFGEPDLTRVATFELNGAQFSIGLVLDAVLSFVLVAAAVYFLVIVPTTRLLERRRRSEVAEVAATPEDIALLQEIRDLLARDRGPA